MRVCAVLMARSSILGELMAGFLGVLGFIGCVVYLGGN
jgi:hypothetical protein